jgi:hypothetical protein
MLSRHRLGIEIAVCGIGDERREARFHRVVEVWRERRADTLLAASTHSPGRGGVAPESPRRLLSSFSLRPMTRRQLISSWFSPNEFLYTANRSPMEALRAPADDDAPELLAYARARIEEAQENIKLAQERQKRQYDKNTVTTTP